MDKVIIFSHESDIDGLGCIILGNLAFKNFEYVLLPNVEKLELKFREMIVSGDLNQYDMIYITDLALYEPSLSLVENSELKDKVKVFDHHKMAIDNGVDKYSFTTIIEEDEDGKKCGTQLFYDYLVRTNLIKKNRAIDTFVELTRLEDTWEWKTDENNGTMAHDLAILFNAIGAEKYLNIIVTNILANENKFEIDDNSYNVIKRKKEDYEKLLLAIIKQIEYFYDESNNKYGAVFADYEFRNEIAEYVRKNLKSELIKYLIIVAMNKGENGQKSYRQIEDNFDVNNIAMNHGGGGHPGAASVNITEVQKEKVKTLSKKEALKYICESSFGN